MSGCEPDDDDEWESWTSGVPADHSIEVVVTENPVIGTLYGPAGEVLVEVRERRVVRTGFVGRGSAP